MRSATRTTLLLLLALTIACATATSASARGSAQYRIEGRGWGHGIGMSQWGAYGFAQRGMTGEQIIQHYYTGTVVAPRPANGPTDVRVRLRSDLATARLQVTSKALVRQAAATLELLPGDIIEVRVAGLFLVATRVRAGADNVIVSTATAADVTIVPEQDGGIKTLFAGDYARAGTAYRGTITARRNEGKVGVINTVPFESYIRGVVPDEMPPSWHPEAIKAQAIAARSYALRSLRPSTSWFDVYSDTRSQVYGGVGAEEATSDAAVAATAGQVARVGDASGEVAHAFFFSTSGGRTAGNDEVWGSTPYPYLRSVPSPYEAGSSYFVWKGTDVRRYTPMQLGAALGYTGTFRAASNTVYPSGYAKTVNISTSQGPKTMTASTLQSRLGLRSTYFRINLLSITAPNTVARGAYVRLSGRAPLAGVTTLHLQQGAGMFKLIKLKPTRPLGAWVVRARLSDTMTASLTRAGIAGPSVQITPSN